MIRSTAQVDDLIFRFAATSLSNDNQLIYVARVTKKLCDGEYYKRRRYAQRGDCIYKYKAGRFEWKIGSLHHGPKDIAHDMGRFPKYSRANVLLSADFRYFGKVGNDGYKAKFPRVWGAVKRLGRGHSNYHARAVRDELFRMKHWIWRSTRKKKSGEPMHKPTAVGRAASFKTFAYSQYA